MFEVQYRCICSTLHTQHVHTYSVHTTQ